MNPSFTIYSCFCSFGWLPLKMPCVPLVPENNTHVLAEFDCLDPLLAALRLDSGRLKCTCLAVSRKWLALGTSAGGLHLIQREGWKQRLILTHKVLFSYTSCILNLSFSDQSE
uniref:HPS5 biogenesis of lysosomal organelles complex 2 subunit 2 n=1 Tax=Periophthalmus magnuspinnatus TaxID=409849 RepID=A0A3B3Z800_9GOBI